VKKLTVNFFVLVFFHDFYCYFFFFLIEAEGREEATKLEMSEESVHSSAFSRKKKFEKNELKKLIVLQTRWLQLRWKFLQKIPTENIACHVSIEIVKEKIKKKKKISSIKFSGF